MRLVLALAVLVLLPAWSHAQPQPPISVDLDSGNPELTTADQRAEKAKAYGERVRYVKIDARWAKDVTLPLAPGDELTSEKISKAMQALRQVIHDDAVLGYGARSKGELGVLHIDVDYDTSPDPAGGARTVGVIFRPYYLRFSLERIGDNVLPIPRSPRPTFYQNVPWPLLALKPSFGVFEDRTFGTALGGSLDADLLNLRLPGRLETSGGTRHLDVHASGLKAVDESFYRTAAGVGYREQRSGTLVQQFSVRANYDDLKEPLGRAEHSRTAALGGVGVTLTVAPNTRLSLDTGYRWTDDRLDGDALNPRTRATSREQVNRVLLDAIPPQLGGFGRAAVWEDNGWLSSGGAYQRLAARLGYSKEVALQPSQTIGLEVLAGAGAAWGDVPAYVRFFGGNSSSQFLYAGVSSPSLLNMPAGPLIRSFGEGQAGFRTAGGVRGGLGFWHVNLNFALPVPGLSRALIPNEVTDLQDSQGRPVTIKQMLRKQVDVSGPSMLGATLKHQGMTAEEAAQKTEDVFAEIKPATHFMIDDANLYAIKPLLLFDVGGLMDRGGSPSETWLAAGAGVQVTVVTAKFELGYMRTFSGPTFGDRGNIFARLVFQNLF